MNSEQVYDLAMLDKWLDGGLCDGSGDGKNTVCLEQAVALCAGLPLTDHLDSCVAPAVSTFGRRMNDRAWSSPTARAAGLRELAYAQLGTAGKLDERKWIEHVAELIIREVVPLVFRKVALLPKLAAYREAVEAAALKCETEGTEASAREALTIAAAVATYAAAAATATYAAAAATAATAAYAAAAATATTAAYAAATATATAAYAAAAATAATAAYAAAAAAATATRSKASDEILAMAANIGARAMREQING